MRQTYVVLGYGIPRNILKDENYCLYLKSAFNRIYAACADRDRWNPVIIFSGGKTDMFRPYRRTEAQEMMRLFRTLMRRPAVKKRTAGWLLVPETRALSTLDNFLYSAKILSTRKLLKNPVTVFGEETRRIRISAIVKKTMRNTKVETIDFDQSANRYLDPAFLRRKESEALKLDLWALRQPENLKKHRELFKKKLAYLRDSGPKKHTQAVKKWWEQELREMTSLE